MKRIAIRDDFNVFDVSDEEDVQIIIGKINVEENADIQLDLSGCLIDYPATSKLVDTIIEQLSSLPGAKKIQIVTDYMLPITTVINWVLLGSNKLNMHNTKELPPEEIIQTIRTALGPFNISLTITIRNKAGKTCDEQTI